MEKTHTKMRTGRLGGSVMGLESVLTSTLSLVGPTSIAIIVPTIRETYLCCEVIALKQKIA